MSRNPADLYPHDKWMAKFVLPFVPRWVKPNHITTVRFVSTPIVAYLLATGNFDIGVPAFALTAMTDALDGSLARVRRQITDWGTFYDPVADKLLITSAVIIIVMQHVNIFFGFTIILIEALIAFGGYIRRKKNGHVKSANMWGKMKMNLQVCGVMLLLIAVWSGVDLFIPFSIGTLSIAMVFAIISLYTYSL